MKELAYQLPTKCLSYSLTMMSAVYLSPIDCIYLANSCESKLTMLGNVHWDWREALMSGMIWVCHFLKIKYNPPMMSIANKRHKKCLVEIIIMFLSKQNLYLLVLKIFWVIKREGGRSQVVHCTCAFQPPLASPDSSKLQGELGRKRSRTKGL